ncbi:LacI family DNA-binding transcriptional regulator [Ammoniphilus resinae]|uniref:LacI family transcriptional regulator n=1 Tax=Ammoniphilus resinae TaxID=861532 RepID=A0ABS4GQT8_9BACL|nr:LacI family DNA-binding transcriptional regulator [Ammoniphilus resinae]MBP1932638.1 LacI family transcriptional regulator [Ammoniphilus resinae]
MNSTILDIAKLAGVSTATVSRVLNNYPFVKEQTRNKVLEAIEALNYYPDLVARSMVKGRTYNIGLIVGTLGNPFFAETSEVIIKTAEMYKCHVTLCVSEENETKLSEYVDLLCNKRVDGLIIGSIFKGVTIPRLKSSNIPYVLYNRKNVFEDADYVIQDNFQAAYEAVNHLVRLGHRKIAILHGPQVFDSVAERLEGYYKALQDAKLKTYDHFHQEVHFEKVDADLESSMNRMMEDKNRPTAIFATADFLALAAIEYLMNKGYRIPEDVAIVGFDNLRLSGHSMIGLTTVGQRAEDMARLAVERLMQKIEQTVTGNSSEEDSWKIRLKPELIIRRSCGAHLKDMIFNP